MLMYIIFLNRTPEPNELIDLLYNVNKAFGNNKKIKVAKNGDQFHKVSPSDTISNEIYDDLRDLYVLKDIVSVSIDT